MPLAPYKEELRSPACLTFCHAAGSGVAPQQRALRGPSLLAQLEIRQCLEKVYGLAVVSVRTINYQGEKRVVVKNNKAFSVRHPDYKKVHVTLQPPQPQQPPAPAP